MQQFIEDDSQRPNITFCRVIFLIQNLRSHVDRTAHTSLIGHRGVFNNFTESKIAYFEVACVDENVCGFEISVNGAVSGQLLVTFDDLLHYNHNFCLGETLSFAFFEVLLEVTILAVLHDDVETSFAVENLHQLNDVWMLKFAQNSNLFVDGSL